MTTTIFHRTFAPIRRHLGPRVAGAVRGVGTAVLAPILFSLRSGHFVSSLRARAVAPGGEALPWYTYPAIDFLKCRSFEGRRVLEFGAGQSTQWWAERAARVLALEGDPNWFAEIAPSLPPSVDLRMVTMRSPDACVTAVREILKGEGERFDVIVIDGLYRREMVDIALNHVTDDGAVICDNAEGYGFHEAFRGSGLGRVDFSGNAPGVVMPHATSIYFKPGCFLFGAEHPIPGMEIPS